MIEGRINDLCQKIGHSEIIECGKNDHDRVVFGATVIIEDLETGENVTYRLVGPYEADIQAGTLSVSSPLGKALIGREEGEQIRVQAPKGQREFEILEIRA